MLKNITFSLTGVCNGNCLMCNIWKNDNINDMLSLEQIEYLLTDPALSQIDTISLTGGEIFLRDDLIDVINIIKEKSPQVNRIFLNTNGTLITPVKNVCKHCENLFENVILSVSLEGNKEINKSVRGIDTYDDVIKLIEEVKKTSPKVNICISTTLSKNNAYYDNLVFLKELSNKYNCGFSFRLADNCDLYYKNGDIDFSLTRSQLNEVVKYIEDYEKDNQFLNILKDYILTGNVPIMYNNDEYKCMAGREFAFINHNGEVMQCLYSDNVLGSLNERITDNFEFKESAGCPCCTDCAIFPMLEYNQKVRKRTLNDK